MFTNVTVFSSLANIDSLPNNKSELCCRITRANIADMFAVMFVSGVIERTTSPANMGKHSLPNNKSEYQRTLLPNSKSEHSGYVCCFVS